MYAHLCMWVYMSMCGCRGQKRTPSVLLYYVLGLQVCGHTSFLLRVLGFKVMSHPHTPKLSLQPPFLDLVINLYSFLSLSLFCVCGMFMRLSYCKCSFVNCFHLINSVFMGLICIDLWSSVVFFFTAIWDSLTGRAHFIFLLDVD